MLGLCLTYENMKKKIFIIKNLLHDLVFTAPLFVCVYVVCIFVCMRVHTHARMRECNFENFILF